MESRLIKILSDITGYSKDELKERESEPLLTPHDCLVAMENALRLKDDPKHNRKFNAGDVVRIIGNTSDHKFDLNEEVTLYLYHPRFDGSGDWLTVGRRDYWYVKECDMELVNKKA